MIVQGEIRYGKSGIYCIENVVNKKKYIGRASNMGKRKNHYFCYLPSNKTKQTLLQNAFNKEGAHSFCFYPVKYCEKSELYKEEQYWMDFFKTLDRRYGYNIRLADEKAPLTEEHKKRIGLGNTGKIRSEEAKEKNRQKHLGLKHSKETIEKRTNAIRKLTKSILQFDLDGNFIRKYDCQRDAFNFNGWKESGQICDCCHGRCLTAHGFKWSYNLAKKEI